MSAALLTLLFATSAIPVEPPDANPPDPQIADHMDVLQPARQGQLQCFQPNEDARTCKIITSYKFEADGRIMNTAQLLMDESGPAVMVVTSPVEVRDGAVCGNLSALPNARFVVAGQPATPGQDSGYRLLLSVAPKQGEVCARWVGLGDGGYRASGTLDGKPKRDYDQRMIWVEPGDGFRVAP